ncbi:MULTISPECIES: HPr kinase/phosphorylase [unclassified Sphingomonas]|uniref:HPr kinase/phosphorylase n=1 Tax=unclassified Sphingomonas TaxID=196159 RepID=UPI001617E2DB|nr:MULTISPECIES: aldolase [unclassified Sphingomonas]MBB3345908.1 serine kinase of HPr protein (carbohydrate metabolism regulator) [Sphingomonas sp. BK069]MBB3474498.1 serine kinase of HPr protein (carbohydrate metabolism regulator) [Sphingomonas sp. BK345]
MTAPVTLHATAVALGGRAVLLTGPSGAGKSDLALRLIDRGAELVADDYTMLVHDGADLVAGSPATIAGRMEVRGLGIVDRPYRRVAPVALVVALGEEGERMPEPRWIELAGVTLPEIVIDPRWPSAPIKVEYALARLKEMPS